MSERERSDIPLFENTYLLGTVFSTTFCRFKELSHRHGGDHLKISGSGNGRRSIECSASSEGFQTGLEGGADWVVLTSAIGDLLESDSLMVKIGLVENGKA